VLPPRPLQGLLELAEQALRTWEPCWSGFLAAELREQACTELETLSELAVASDGGWPQAERRRLLLCRRELLDSAPAAPLQGLRLSGNFLFDPAEPADVIAALLAAGALPEEIGDIWIRGDRGAQLVLCPQAAQRLDGLTIVVRTVEAQLQATAVAELQLPGERIPKALSSVEASLRLDAVASAGFGLSRNRMAELIRTGAVRINWQPVSSPSKELRQGDRVQLAGRGELAILEVQPTKRERWRLRMERR
jgi:photosystem II S4 domain protein